MSEGALSKNDQLGLREAKAVERRVIRRARKIIERGIDDAAAVSDEGIDVVTGLGAFPDDPKRRNVATDMRKSKRNAPVYIDIAARLIESHDKIEAARNHGPRTQLNNYTVVNFTPPTYETISLDPIPEDGK